MREDTQEIGEILEEEGYDSHDFVHAYKSISGSGDLNIDLRMQTWVENPGEYLIPLAEHYREEYDGHVRLDANNSNGTYHLNVFEGQHDDLDRSELRGEMTQHR